MIRLLCMLFILSGCRPANTLDHTIHQAAADIEKPSPFNRHLGNMKINNKDYMVMARFKVSETATGFRGQSTLWFLSESDTINYSFDMPESMPDSLSGNRLYKDGAYSEIRELKEIICINDRCYMAEGVEW